MTWQRALLCIAILAPLAAPLATRGQTATAANSAPATAALPHFDLADVHPSPFANQPNTDVEYMASGRFLARQATMVDLINFAWNVDDNRVLRGPSWLDFDRFDMNARAPRDSSVDNFRLMLRALLAERFSLAARADTKEMPAFVMTAGKSVKMKAADAGEVSNCQYVQQPQNQGANAPPPYIVFDCKATTMDQLADDLHNWANGYLTNPVVNQTALTGAYDFQIKWTGRGQLARAGADGISIFDAVEKQLGLKLEAKPAPLPVVFVDSVNEKPTPNAPGLDKAMPPPPPAEFDVAILKPSAPDTKGINGQINGGQVNLQGASVQWLITWAWNISDDMIADAPKWLNQDRWDLLGKVAHDPASDGPNAKTQIDFDQLQGMVKKLLADRFGLQVHMEDRPADAYSLLAVNPHMKKADPDNRTGCHEGPGPDGKDPRIANPILGRLLTCQNMTMVQFGDILRIQANGYVHAPVLDKTGLTDAYDFTLSFSTIGQTRQVAPKDPNADPNAPTATDPNGALSLLDALPKELGVKLEKEKRPVQMLVIDHVNQTPTEN